MAKPLNTLGKRISGTTRLIASGRSGVINLQVPDQDFLVPEDVAHSLPDPFCTGVMFNATCGTERLIAHFGVDKARPEASLTGLRILKIIVDEVMLPQEEQCSYRATVTGDWYRLTICSVKTLVLSVHQADLEKYTPHESANLAYG